MKDELDKTKRALFFADAYLQQAGSGNGSIPLIISIARRLADGEITDADAVDELAQLIAEGKIDPRLLGSSGDHPDIVKAVADKLLATSGTESFRPKVVGGIDRSIERDE